MSTTQQNEQTLPENNEVQTDTDLATCDSEIVISNVTITNSETTYNQKKKKKVARKIILSSVSCFLVVIIILSCFIFSAYFNAKNKYESISKSIAEMKISQDDEGNWLQNKLYEKHFKEKNEQDIVNLLKRNFYSGNSNLVDTDSISNIEKVKKVCNDFGLDETKYADVYLYIDTALKLEEYAKYNKLSKHLENTTPLLTNINISSYYTIEMVASALQQCIDNLTIIISMIQGDIYDSQVSRYYVILKDLAECIIDAVKAGQKNDMITMQRKIREYAFTLLDVYELLDEVEKIQKEVISGMTELIEIEARINMQ